LSKAVFTTIRIQDFKPKWLEDHVERILSGAELFKVNIDEKTVLDLVENALEKNNLKDARMRIILHENGALETTLETFVDLTKPLSLKLKEIDVPQGALKVWPHRSHVEIEGEEVVLIEKNTGFVLEGSYTNVFVKTKDGYLTPPADGKILAGIGRKHFIRELQEKGETVREEWFKVEMLNKNKILLTNALRGVIRTKHLS
jgi:branched-subunit amino acid aminotransferase/4-amino-4-deoxychorismate lyase